MKDEYSLEKEIKGVKEKLQGLISKDKRYVFHCPKCKVHYPQLGNYREMGMCFDCYSKKDKAELDDRLSNLREAIVVDVITERDIFSINPKTRIKKIILRTKDGELKELYDPPQVYRV